MHCQFCARAAAAPLTDGYADDCLDCSARALARQPEFADAIAADAITPEYRAALQEAFGDAALDAHERVRFWAARIAAARGAPGP